MADYGFQLGALDGISVVTTGFANYSVLDSFSKNVNSGINTITLPTHEDNPVVLVRHPGLDVGFLRFINTDASTKLEVWANTSGTIDFVIFTPSQTVGLEGHGLILFDADGNEIYHSDLQYLNISDKVDFNTNIGSSGYYVMGSYYGMGTSFSTSVNEVSGSYPVYDLKCGETCVPYWDGTYDCYFSCWQELSGYFAWSVVEVWVYATKKIYCVRHNSNNSLESVTNNFWSGQVYYKKEYFDGPSPGGAVVFPLPQPTIDRLFPSFNSSNVSNYPNQLLYSSMDYA